MAKPKRKMKPKAERTRAKPKAKSKPKAAKRKPVTAKLVKPVKSVKPVKPVKPVKSIVAIVAKSTSKPAIKLRPAQALRGVKKLARVLSEHPEAIRSRQRRAEAKPRPRKSAKAKRAARERQGLADAKLAAELGLSGQPHIAPRKPRGPGSKKQKAPRVQDLPIDQLRELAVGWLETLRDIAATITPTSLDVTDPSGREMIAPEVAGAAPARPRGRGRAVGRRPWLIVGRFEFLASIGYETVGEVLSAWRDDFALEVAIHPDRLSQIRIVYEDPKERRGDGDDFIAQIGAWAYVTGELVREIVGSGGVVADDDQRALMARYAQSVVPRMYVYFSPDLMGGVTIDIGKEVVKRFKL